MSTVIKVEDLSKQADTDKENAFPKLDYIDAVRGLAILGVLMVHTTQYGINNLPSAVFRSLSEGARGVQLFYLASAFTLFLSFHNRKKNERFPMKNFFIRRFFRIAPMYYLGICYYLFQDGLGARYWLGDMTHISSLNILSNFLFLHGLNPYWINSVVPGGWSIAVEVTFYLLLPLLFYKIKTINQSINFLILSVLLSAVCNFALSHFNLSGSPDLWSNYLGLYFPSQLPIFALGIFLYYLIFGDRNQKINGSSLLLLGTLFIFQLATSTQIFFPKHILFGFAFLLFVFALSRYQSVFFVNPVTIYLGKISFSLYLVHFAVLYWLTKLGIVDFSSNPVFNYCIRFILVCAFGAIISTFFYYLIELPSQRLGKTIIKRLAAPKFTLKAESA
jgi:peptidoglycan/LPS O-acetylase OafA/YrhL